MPYQVLIVVDDALTSAAVTGPLQRPGLIYAALGLATKAMNEYKPPVVEPVPAGAMAALNGQAPGEPTGPRLLKS